MNRQISSKNATLFYSTDKCCNFLNEPLHSWLACRIIFGQAVVALAKNELYCITSNRDASAAPVFIRMDVLTILI
jgi:hypothetical protein